jgi:hypothetical protein
MEKYWIILNQNFKNQNKINEDSILVFSILDFLDSNFVNKHWTEFINFFYMLQIDVRGAS